MPLRELSLPAFNGKLARSVREFLREAERRIDRFQADGRVLAFVPCDYPAAFGVLQQLLESPFVQRVSVTETTAEHYARLAETLRRRGTPLPPTTSG